MKILSHDQGKIKVSLFYADNDLSMDLALTREQNLAFKAKVNHFSLCAKAIHLHFHSLS